MRDLMHHAAMLSDQERLRTFRAAMSELIGSEDLVVDIGTGSGILAHHSASALGARTIGIEYFRESAEFAKNLLASKKATRASILNQASYSAKLEEAPTVLVGELLGAIGPEENIVEAFYEFCRRHPTIRTLIPGRVDVRAEIISHPAIEARWQSCLAAFSSAWNGLAGDWDAEKTLERGFAREIQRTQLRDGTRTLAEPATLKSYNLGIDSRSEFESTVAVGGHPAGAAVHLYFDAALSDSVTLSTRHTAPYTHWAHSYARIPAGARTARISYDARTRAIVLDWEFEA